MSCMVFMCLSMPAMASARSAIGMPPAADAAA
jgi:hypothetical protein